MPNRRRFLSAAGVGTLFTLAGPGPKVKAAGSANDRISLGFIGSGIRGTGLINEFKRVQGLRFPAVCDLYDGCLARAKEQIAADIAVSKDYRAVLDRKDIDAVVIATPDHLHKKLTLDALSAGKHVYIEKPLTWSLDEGAEIIEAQKRSGKLLQVGSQGKTSPLTAKARELVQSGALGQVTMIRLSNHRNDAQGAWKYPVPPDASGRTIAWSKFLGDRPNRSFDPEVFFQWRRWWEFSGGVATDLFVHLLTWLHEVMNVQAPVSAVSQGGLYYWKDGRDVPDVLNTLFEYREGFVVDMYVHLASAYPEANNVILGTKAALTWTDDTLFLHPEPEDTGVQGYGTMQWPKAARERYYVSKGWLPSGRPKTPLTAPKPIQEIKIERGPSHAEWFIISLRDNKPSRETAEEGHLAAGAGHIANIAYRKGRKIGWDWKTGKITEG
ncbi:MAG: Gfo/Idh/MocA family oxidoreductase [Bryobacteraceae bacterium]